MSPVVVIGFGAIDAALISQAVYAYRDMRRSEARRPEASPSQDGRRSS